MPFMNIPDNYDLWERHDAEMEMRMESLPKCAECGEPIQQDMAVCIHGRWYCDSCLDDFKTEVTEHGF